MPEIQGINNLYELGHDTFQLCKGIRHPTPNESQNTMKFVSWTIFSNTEQLNCWKTSFHQISIMASSGLRKMFI